jgi:hypothetical protein
MPPFPGGRATIIRFDQGAPTEIIHGVVAEVLSAAKGTRKPKTTWHAMMGEFFMGGGATVVVISAAVPKPIVSELIESLAILNPTVRRVPLKELDFRGRNIAVFSDTFEDVSGLGEPPTKEGTSGH